VKALGRRPEGARLERLRASPLWTGEGFRNRHPILPGLRDPNTPPPTLREFLCKSDRRMPPGPLPAVDPLDAWRRPSGSGLRVTWLGHSTVLIEIDGVRVLTDPVWGLRASPLRVAGPRRFQPVPVPLRALPRLDLVLVSHDHYDHLDHPTIRQLRRRGAPFVTSLGVGAHLESWGVPHGQIVELDWWESYTLPSAALTVTATPSQHFSGRTPGSRNSTLWSSLVIRSPRHTVFFSGDTGLTNEYRAIRERFGPFDLVMLEVGAFHPAWGDMHLGPENALKALSLLGGGVFLPIHWGTFALGMHAWDQPAEALLELAPRAGAQLMMPRLGQAVEPAHAEPVEPWWRAAAESARRRGLGSLVGGTLPKTLPWPMD
jgi:L-ascorbate metabolism protein UlaG (beta-lactamase superfamily)